MELLVQKHWETEEVIQVPDGMSDKEIESFLLLHGVEVFALIKVVSKATGGSDKRELSTDANWVGTTVIDENRDDFCVAHWTKE